MWLFEELTEKATKHLFTIAQDQTEVTGTDVMPVAEYLERLNEAVSIPPGDPGLGRVQVNPMCQWGGWVELLGMAGRRLV